MRSGACTLQQTLTAEAASVLKHSLGLARRRGHAQVTPLHVAATLLSLRASPLRRACLLQSHQQHQQQQQQLQCRALELCFNVALNRLPTISGPLLHSQPSLSNALIAALKRAQAYQRRGCIEQQQQQQPLLTIKVELEQLIISILDDPSVSRVMREAGFSSTAVKTNIEDSSSSSSYSSSSCASSVFQCYNSSGGVVFSSPSENHRESMIINNTSTSLRNAHFLALFSPLKKASSVYPITDSGDFSSMDGDVKVVLDVLLRKKKRNTVIVGDSVSLTEGLVGEIMGKIERGDVPDELKSIQFIKFQFSPVSLRFMKREQVEIRLSALKRKVESVAASGGGGAIFYVGDLKWTVEEEGGGELVSGYNAINHLVEEMEKIFGEDEGRSSSNSNSKVWLMGTASYQTYIKCQMRKPYSLQNLWALQAVPVPSPSAGLGLTLHHSSVYDPKMSITQNPSHMKEDHDKLNCCEECASNYEKEAQLFKPGHKKLLPSWLQSSTEAHQKDELAQLKRKWNRLCHFLHQSKQPQQNQNQNHWSNNTLQYTPNAKIYPYNSSYPWWPNQSNVFTDSSSISFADDSAENPSHTTIEFNFSEVTQKKQGTDNATITNMEGNKEVKITLALGNSTFGGGSGQKEVENNITETTLRKRAHVCKMLQENVPWQSETLPSIAESLVVDYCSKTQKQWFLLQGNDSVGKTRLALAIAESVFRSVDSLIHLDMKKLENYSETPVTEIVAGSLKRNEKVVVFVEDVEFAEPQFKKYLADEFEASKFGNLRIKDGNSGQAIFILTSGGNRRSSEEHQNNDSVMRLVLKVMTENKANSGLSSPSLGHKRNAELNFFGKTKIPRIEENEECNRKKDFSRQSSFNTLDLNIKADEEEEEENDDDDDDGGENSHISSDLTGEPITDNNMNSSSNGFLDSIENRFEFNVSPARNKEKEEMFLTRVKGSFEEVFCGMMKNQHVNFSVDERVIKEIGVGCGSFTNSMFEKWLKDIFQSTLLQHKVNYFGDNGKEGIVFVTLCLGGKGENRKMDSDGGFMGSCLPKNIHVKYFMD